MVIALAQPLINGVATSGSTVAATFGSNTTTGNTVIAVIFAFPASGTLAVTGVAMVGGSGTFAALGSGQVGLSGVYSGIEAWVAPNVTGGTTPAITATLNGTIAFADIVIYEFSGTPTTTQADGVPAGAAQTAATAITTPTITTTNAGSIIFGAFAPSTGQVTIGEAGWQFHETTQTDAGVQYQIQTATQSNLASTATQTASSIYGAYIFALKPSGGGGGPTQETMVRIPFGVAQITSGNF